MKHIIHDNVNLEGSLNNDKAALAIFQFRNTPNRGIGLSHAQMLFHRQLRDGIQQVPDIIGSTGTGLYQHSSLKMQQLPEMQPYRSSTMDETDDIGSVLLVICKLVGNTGSYVPYQFCE